MSTDTEIVRKKWNLLPHVIKVWLLIPPMVIDGVIVFLVATLTTIATAFTSEEAYKYVNPYVLFWTKISVGAITSGLVALQSFRSKVFAEHVKGRILAEQKENG